MILSLTRDVKSVHGHGTFPPGHGKWIYGHSKCLMGHDTTIRGQDKCVTVHGKCLPGMVDVPHGMVKSLWT
jgi:hypothetical protein